MQASQTLELYRNYDVESARREALEKCCEILTQDGFDVVLVEGKPENGTRPPDLLAANEVRQVQVFVLLNGEIDSPETKERLRASLHKGETLICVPWPLRWRALSNLERWGVRGIAVTGW